MSETQTKPKLNKAEAAEAHAVEESKAAIAAPSSKERALPTPTRWQLAEHAYSTFTYKVPAHVSPEATVDPEYFWMMNQQLNKGDVIVVIDELYRWEYTTRVLGIDRQLQMIRTSPIISLTDHARQRATIAIDWSNVSLRYRGPRGRWSVLRGTEVLEDGFDTEEEAQAWLNKKKNQGL